MNPTRHYQIFISSTYRDLKEQRQAVMTAVLKLGHMPVGMELFPASSNTVDDVIKRFIDAADYYLVIVGGRYGSTSKETGLSYTELEYEYAVSKGKPVIPLVHEDPSELQGAADVDQGLAEKLQQFIAKLRDNHHVAHWSNIDALGAIAYQGVAETIKDSPRTGWIREDAIEAAMSEEAIRLRLEIESLRRKIQAYENDSPDELPGTEGYMQGDDAHEIKVSGNYWDASQVHHESSVLLERTWNAIFAAIGPYFIGDVESGVIYEKVARFFESEAKREFKEQRGVKLTQPEVDNQEVATILTQFQTLRLIAISEKKRPSNSKGTYWALTPRGEAQMQRLRAIRRPAAKKEPRSSPDSTGQASPPNNPATPRRGASPSAGNGQ